MQTVVLPSCNGILWSRSTPPGRTLIAEIHFDASTIADMSRRVNCDADGFDNDNVGQSGPCGPKRNNDPGCSKMGELAPRQGTFDHTRADGSRSCSCSQIDQQ